MSYGNQGDYGQEPAQQAPLIRPGKYKARVTDYAAKKTQKGDPAIAIRFDVYKTEEETISMVWQGGLNGEVAEGREKSQRDITFDALEACGFDWTKNNDLTAIAAGAQSGALDFDRDVSVSLEMETYNGRPQVKIKWVNAYGAGAFQNVVDAREFAQQCAGLNLRGDILQRRNKTQAGKPTTQGQQQGNGPLSRPQGQQQQRQAPQQGKPWGDDVPGTDDIPF